MLCEIEFTDHTTKYVDLEDVSAYTMSQLVKKYDEAFRVADSESLYNPVYCFCIRDDWVYFYFYTEAFKDRWFATYLPLSFYAYETDECKEFTPEEVVAKFESCFGSLKNQHGLTIDQVHAVADSR